MHCFQAPILLLMLNPMKRNAQGCQLRAVFMVASVPHVGADSSFSVSLSIMAQLWCRKEWENSSIPGSQGFCSLAVGGAFWAAKDVNIQDISEDTTLQSFHGPVASTRRPEPPMRGKLMDLSEKFLSIPEAQLLHTVVLPVLLAPCTRTPD